MSSCLDAAGVPHWVFGAELININPFHEIAYEGYRIVVCDEDLLLAIGVLTEARATATLEGERLSKRAIIVPHLLVTLFFFPTGFGIWYFPLRRFTWHDVSVDPRDRA